MSILVWNCWGLGNHQTVRHLLELRKQKRPKIIFLSETKLKKGGMEFVRRRLGYENCLEVECRGLSGSLALLWDRDVNLEVCSFSSNHIDALINSEKGTWRFTGLYGFPEANRKRATFRLLDYLGQHIGGISSQGSVSIPQFPWCVLGDFNCIVADYEKQGGALYPRDSIEAFTEFLQLSSLSDMGFDGSLFTWSRGGTYERLDRGLATQRWYDLFPNYVLKVLAPISSDHSPLCLSLDATLNVHRRKRKFKFEGMWLLEESCKEVVNQAWKQNLGHRDMQSILMSIATCGEALSKWDKEFFGNVQQQLRHCQESFNRIRASPPDPVSRGEEESLLREMELLLDKEELLWKQRSKEHWLLDGVRNSKFFLSRANARQKFNRVKGLYDDQDRWVSDDVGMGQIVHDYFNNIFLSSNPSRFERVTDLLSSQVTHEQNQLLLKPLTKGEVHAALMAMEPTKSPGPDGMNPQFFQFFWDLVGTDIFTAMRDVLNRTQEIPVEMSHTNVVLIPKCQYPTRMTELRPISLCNVTYRIFSKILANRLKQLLPSIISLSQSAFVPGRLITDNLLVASEILHYLKHKTSGRRGWMASKIDMSKAFDRMEWSYLEAVLLKLGFHPDFVAIIM